VEYNMVEDFGITVRRSNPICFKTLVETDISFSVLPRLTPNLLSLEEISGDENKRKDLDL
jgi:hypothetical protein